MFLSTSTTNLPSGCTWNTAVNTTKLIFPLQNPGCMSHPPHHEGARKLSQHQTQPSYPQKKDLSLHMFLITTPSAELVLLWGQRHSSIPHQPAAKRSQPQGSSAPYLHKHFLLVHGSHHLAHIGALLLQQLQLLPQQPHCREKGTSADKWGDPKPPLSGQHPQPGWEPLVPQQGWPQSLR